MENKYHVCVQVTPIEMDKISFTKPMHKRVVKRSSNRSSTMHAVLKMKCVSETKDVQKLSFDVCIIPINVKTSGSESQGQEEAASMRVFRPMRPLQ